MGRSGGGPSEATITGPFEVDVLKYGTAATAGTALAAAIAAADLTAHTRLAFPTASALTWDSTPALPRGITGSLAIDFKDSLVTLTSGALRLLDFNKVADYDTFQNIEVCRATIDGANLAGISHDHVIIGTLKAGVTTTRVNLNHIWIHDITTVNVPTGAVARENVALSCSAESGDTLCNITDILVERLNLTGSVGVAVLGAASGTTANVFYDRIVVRDIYHTTGGVQGSPVTSGGVQVGSKGYGGSVTVERVQSFYAGDVGIEVDGATQAVLNNCVCEDAYNANFLITNFRAPANANIARVTLTNCQGRRILQTAGTAYGFQVPYNNSVTASALVLDHCSFYKNNTGMGTVGQAFNASAASGIPSITFTDFSVDMEGGDYATPTTAINDSAIAVRCLAGATTRLTINGARIRMYGVREGGAGVVTRTGISLYGSGGSTAQMIVDFNNVTMDMSLTGASSGSLWGVDFGSPATMTYWGVVRGFRVLNMTGDASPRGLQVTTGVVQNRLNVSDCDFSGMPGGTEILYSAAVNKDKVLAQGNIWHTNPTPVGLTGLTTATGALVATGWAALVTFTQGSGSAVTAIDYSTNGGTTYTNFLTQASGALPAGFDQTIGPLPPNALVKVTFTTTQPTITLVPINP